MRLYGARKLARNDQRTRALRGVINVEFYDMGKKRLLVNEQYAQVLRALREALEGIHTSNGV